MGRTAGSYERAQPLTATHTSRSISNSNSFFQQLLPLSIPSPETLPLPIRLPTHPGHAATHSSTNSVLHKSSLHRLLPNSLYHSQIHPNSDNKILSPSPVPPTPRHRPINNIGLRSGMGFILANRLKQLVPQELTGWYLVQ